MAVKDGYVAKLGTAEDGCEIYFYGDLYAGKYDTTLHLSEIALDDTDASRVQGRPVTITVEATGSDQGTTYTESFTYTQSRFTGGPHYFAVNDSNVPGSELFIPESGLNWYYESGQLRRNVTPFKITVNYAELSEPYEFPYSLGIEPLPKLDVNFWKNNYAYSYNSSSPSTTLSKDVTLSVTRAFSHSTYTIPSTVPTAQGYTFRKWVRYDEKCTTPVEYNPGDSFTIGYYETPIDLYALWYEDPSVTIDEFYRCDAEGNATDGGQYVKVVFTAGLPMETGGSYALRISDYTSTGTLATGEDEIEVTSIFYADLDPFIDKVAVVNLTVTDAISNTVTASASHTVSYEKPVIGSSNVYRCDSEGETADEGTMGHLIVPWVMQKMKNQSAVMQTGPTIKVRVMSSDGETKIWPTSDWKIYNPSPTTTTADKLSGELDVVIGSANLFDLNEAYNVEVKVLDAFYEASLTLVLRTAFFTMDFLGDYLWDYDNSEGEQPGHGISFGSPAKHEGFNVSMLQYAFERLDLPVYRYDTRPDEEDVPCEPCIVVVSGTKHVYLYGFAEGGQTEYDEEDIESRLTSAQQDISDLEERMVVVEEKSDPFPLEDMIPFQAGIIYPFCGDTVPDGYLLCDGRAVSRTTYSELFYVIGTTYGEGDGTTTFNIPDLTDRFLMGEGSLNDMGDYPNSGLPNITGEWYTAWNSTVRGFWNMSGSGAFYKSSDSSRPGRVTSEDKNANSNTGMPFFDASRSNPIYGNSTIVQPPAAVVKYVISTGSKYLGIKGEKGEKGDTGEKGVKGDTGTAAGFGTPTATVDSNHGMPSVTVTASGPDTAKVFDFTFHNLKGDPFTIDDVVEISAGMISPFAGSTAPDGYLLCDGSDYSSEDYPELYQVIGIAYGSGDGVNTDFNVPDLRGRTMLGAGTGTATDATAHTLGEEGGEETHTLLEAEIPSHNHNANALAVKSTSIGTSNDYYVFRGINRSSQIISYNTELASSTGGGDAHNNMQPYAVVNYIIATGKKYPALKGETGDVGNVIHIGTDQPAANSSYILWYNPLNGAFKAKQYISPDPTTVGDWGWRELTFADENNQNQTADTVPPADFLVGGKYYHVLARDGMAAYVEEALGYDPDLGEIDGSMVIFYDSEIGLTGNIPASTAAYAVIYDGGDTMSMSAYNSSNAKVNLSYWEIGEGDDYGTEDTVNANWNESWSKPRFNPSLPIYIVMDDTSQATFDQSTATYYVHNGQVTVL